MTDTTQITKQNTAETMRDVMAELSQAQELPNPMPETTFNAASLITLPNGRKVEDVTKEHLQAAQYLKPARRKGTARLDDLQSLIDWSNRFKGETSVLYADPNTSGPSLTCIADYHAEGKPDPLNAAGEESARHCHHRGVYRFPLSDEWKIWNKISGVMLEKDDLGELIETQAKDIMDPTPAIIKMAHDKGNQGWENRLIETAQKIEGRYGQLTELLAMSRQFQVHETSNLTVKSNRDTGEGEIQFVNEHKTTDGKPLKIPNLIIIAIPVFMGGAPYRMPVRFRYRKQGGNVKFIMSIYNPERAFKDAFEEAVTQATEKTGLTTFKGTPET